MQQDPYGVQRAHNPYAPPAHDQWANQYDFEPLEPQGNYWAGFAVGLIFALLGLIIVYIVGKPETKRGSLHGLGIRIGLTVLVVIMAALVG